MRDSSIIDLDGGAQPIWNEAPARGQYSERRDLQLRRAAAGAQRRTGTLPRRSSDTEVIVHAYEEWGVAASTASTACSPSRSGTRAEHARRWRAIRFGIKPLYYWDDGRTLVFGSEIERSFASPASPRTVDPERSCDSVDLRRTSRHRERLFAGIDKLLPGHALVVDQTGARMERFHRMIPTHPGESRSKRTSSQSSAGRSHEAVRRQMVADVPVGVMLLRRHRLVDRRRDHEPRPQIARSTPSPSGSATTSPRTSSRRRARRPVASGATTTRSSSRRRVRDVPPRVDLAPARSQSRRRRRSPSIGSPRSLASM